MRDRPVGERRFILLSPTNCSMYPIVSHLLVTPGDPLEMETYQALTTTPCLLQQRPALRPPAKPSHSDAKQPYSTSMPCRWSSTGHANQSNKRSDWQGSHARYQ